MRAIFAARPLAREHGRRAAGVQPLAGQGRRSRDCNLGPATPSDVRGCRRIIIPRPRSWQNSLPEAIALRTAWGTDGVRSVPSVHYAVGQHSWSCTEWYVMAHLPALLTGTGTYLPCWICSCQGNANHADWSCAKVWMISRITRLSSPSSLSSKSSSNFCCLGVR